MAADLHIHVFDGITEDDLKEFFSHTLGSKYFSGLRQQSLEATLASHKKIGATPNIWIGEVSWLKAAVFEDRESYVPDPVAKVHELIGEDLPELTLELRDKLLAALEIENKTQYGTAEDVPVRKFLEEHMGKKLFCVSW